MLPKYAGVAGEVSEPRRAGRGAEGDVSETWRPLGYNIRPRRLHAIARESVARYGGELPSDEETLRSFKGIGEYTAGAVLSFAFGQRAAILDTNVARVLFRVFVGRGDPQVARDAAPPLGGLAHGAADAPRLRLQPGADGFRRDALLGAQAEVPECPMRTQLRRLSVQPGATNEPSEVRPSAHRRHRRGDRAGRRVPRHAPARAACTSKGTGSFRAASASRRDVTKRACAARSRRNSV